MQPQEETNAPADSARALEEVSAIGREFRGEAESALATGTTDHRAAHGAARTRHYQGAGGTNWHLDPTSETLGKASQVAKIERLGSDWHDGGVADADEQKPRAVSSVG